jgi:hypothetical protein
VLPQVFISHTTRSQHDLQFAHAIAHYLEEYGVEVWIAPESIPAGVEWEKELVSGIMQDCTHFLVMLSPESIASEWVQQEIKLAQQRRNQDSSLVILPLMLADVSNYPHKDFISRFQNIRYVNDAEEQVRIIAEHLGLAAVPFFLLTYSRYAQSVSN